MTELESDKLAVAKFWDKASCGEDLFLHGNEQANFDYQASERYRLEPYIAPFAEFERSSRKRVLEIGVGLGADHERFARAGAVLTGIDLTPRAIENTKARFSHTGLHSELQVADAEKLPFQAETFDIVFSWGVIHHSPDTPRCVSEIYRVLKPGGVARIMIYQKYSMVGFMLWARYGLLRGRPWTSLDEIYSRYLESPGTKAYAPAEAAKLFGMFRSVETKTVLTHGDLLSSDAGQRHRGALLTLAKAVWPRWLIKLLLPGCGLFLMIKAVK